MGKKRSRALILSPAPPPPSPSPTIQLKKRKKMKKKKTSSEVCLICAGVPYAGSGAGANDEGDRLHVYVLNLNSNSAQDTDIPAVPVLRIKDCEEFFAYCVVNSTIYFFEGVGYDRVWRKSVYFYKLSGSQPTVPTPVLEYTMLHKAAPMKFVKYTPIAVPTPDRKSILVFSGKVVIDSSVFGLDSSECMNFELYDLATNTWQVLPDLSPYLNTAASHSHAKGYTAPSRSQAKGPRCVVQIIAHAFLNESTFFIQTDADDDMRMFTLHLKSPKCWKPMVHNILGGMHRPFMDEFFVVRDRLCLDAYEAYDIHSMKHFRIPLPREEILNAISFQCEEPWYVYPLSMTLLSSGNEPSFCVVYPLPLSLDAHLRKFLRPRFLINVLHFDPATCCDECTRQFKPSSTKSFKFVLTDYSSICCTGLFPMDRGAATT